MQIAHDFGELDSILAGTPGSVLTIGVFDGLHAGHQALIRRTVEESRHRGLQSIVVTFQKHPLSVLAPPYAPRRLIYPDRKRQYVAALGADAMLDLIFSGDLARMQPEQFVCEMLLGRARIQALVCGYDFTFGHRGSGDTELLKRLSVNEGFDVIVLNPVADSGVAVKSTMVRDLLLTGHVADAMHHLTRPYELRGNVVTGFRRGRTLGFPTANLEVDASFVIPQMGVYACYAEIRAEHRLFPAMVNIGTSPTFGSAVTSIEAHFLGFQGELVGKEIALFFISRLRDERKFDGPQQLVEQLHFDRQHTAELLDSPESRQIRYQVEKITAAT